MSLGLRAYHNGGEFSPRHEFNSKSGRWATVDRTADGTGIIKVDVTMTRPMFALDLGTIEVGWIWFQNSAAPSFDVVPFGQPMPLRPDSNFKAGFRARIWDGRAAGTREWSATAGATVYAVEELWDRLTATPEAAAGKVPVIQAVDVIAVPSARGTNYGPVFTLLQWIERDAAVFGPRTVPAPGGAPIVPTPAKPAAATPAVAAWPSPTPTAPDPSPWPTNAKAA